MKVYYNENDSFAAAWLRELIAAGVLPDGYVDERSIEDVTGDDLGQFGQCHFFAGIGGWPLALRLAGWPDDRPVWTGSCPCQPFSVAGKRGGTADKRHLWPEFLRLIAQCRPANVIGEQVASKAGRGWLAGVRANLEELEYAVGAADLCAAGAGAPHIRQRLYWVADAQHAERRPLYRPIKNEHYGENPGWSEAHGIAGTCGAVCDPAGRRVADADGGLAGNQGLQPCREHRQQPQNGGAGSRIGNAIDARLEGLAGDGDDRHEPGWLRSLAPGSAWATSIAIQCADGKARRIEPGIFPLAHGFSNRVGTLRGAGNAIVPQIAAQFVSAFVEASQHAVKAANP